MNLALFDLDNTLLAGDSDYEWAQFLIEQGVLERESYEQRNEEFFEQYKAGRLDILHANAGSYVGGDLVDADNAAIDRMLNLIFPGYFDH